MNSNENTIIESLITGYHWLNSRALFTEQYFIFDERMKIAQALFTAFSFSVLESTNRDLFLIKNGQ